VVALRSSSGLENLGEVEDMRRDYRGDRCVLCVWVELSDRLEISIDPLSWSVSFVLFTCWLGKKILFIFLDLIGKLHYSNILN
jgi:hypothetical protein